MDEFGLGYWLVMLPVILACVVFGFMSGHLKPDWWRFYEERMFRCLRTQGGGRSKKWRWPGWSTFICILSFIFGSFSVYGMDGDNWSGKFFGGFLRGAALLHGGAFRCLGFTCRS